MTNPVNIPSAAFNVERVRAQMLEGVRVPPELFQKAIDKIHSKLDAKVTKFFPFQGQVVSQVEVEDHQTQLAAAEKVMGIAGVYARERDAAPPQPQVALEVDSKTGVVRLIVGSVSTVAQLVESQNDSLQLPLVLESRPELGALPRQRPVSEPLQEEAPQIIKLKQGNLSGVLYKKLFGEPDNGHS